MRYLQLIEVLWLAMASLDRSSELQKPVSKRRLAMVNVRDYREVSYPFCWILAQIYVVLFAILARIRATRTSQLQRMVV